MKRISQRRFEALASYTRDPITRLYAEELGWYEHAGERVLGLMLRDRTDNDFSGAVFGRDAKLRFRWVGMPPFEKSRRHAEVKLRREMERLAAEPDEEYYQGDEKGEPVDFFAPVVPIERLNSNFVKLKDREIFSAARGIVEPMMRWYEDLDGNFVEQFQTTGFDARIWELYLFAAFSEMGYKIDRAEAVPDFRCVNPFLEFWVEATTVNPTRDQTGAVVPMPPTSTPQEISAYLNDYMPIKFGSALTSKLTKRYWEKSHVAGKPLIFAVQDFSGPRSMTYSRSSFEKYIFGYAHDWERNPDGTLRIIPRKIGVHRWGGKEVPSGFFELPDTENISAVVFSNSGTISKFNRMGLLAGFGSRRLRLVRVGTAVDHNPHASAPRTFRYLVGDPAYDEDWREGLDVWHNPKAMYPIDPELLPGAAHHFLLDDGQIQSLTPEWHPMSSFTLQSLEGASAEETLR